MIKLYNLIMDSKRNPLSYIPDTNTRHLVMQLLAWMWCIIFSAAVGSFVVFGISLVAHVLLISGIVITMSTFSVAKRATRGNTQYRGSE